MTVLIKMPFDKWCEKYEPIVNVFDENASFHDGEHGLMFETFGKELDFVLAYAKAKPDNVWTYLDGDDSALITNGYHLVNRIGYFVTYKPAESEAFYEIDVS